MADTTRAAEETVMTSVRLPLSLRNRIDAIARERCCKRSDQIVKALTVYADSWERSRPQPLSNPAAELGTVKLCDGAHVIAPAPYVQRGAVAESGQNLAAELESD